MTRLLITITALVSVILPHALNAQSINSVLQNKLDSLQSDIGMKGLGAAIVCSNEIVWKGASGISSQSPLEAVTTEDAFQIGSITKTITAACILQMADEGLLDLDDSISDYIDTIEYVNPDITIRQLLRHQSGVFDIFANADLQPQLMNQMDLVWTIPNLLETFLQPATFQPGNGWNYSSSNYLLLALIIEEISGQAYYEEFRARFFEPLGLSSFYLPAYETNTVPIAHVWINIFGSSATDDAHSFWTNYVSMNSAAGAAGGYYATPADIARWTRSFLRGDLMSEATMLEATETVNAPGLPNTTYGLGIMRRTFNGYIAYGHGGDLGYSAQSWYFPELDVSIAVCNNDADYISWELIPVVSELLDAVVTNGCETLISTPQEMSEETFVGFYPNPGSGDLHWLWPASFQNQMVNVCVYNATGQMIYTNRERVSQSRGMINEQVFTTGGVYLVSFENDQQQILRSHVLRIGA